MKKHLLVTILLGLVISATSSHQHNDFKIEIMRGEVVDGLLFGKIFLDGKLLGNAYENDALKIPSGTYKGIMLYNSGHNFAVTYSDHLANARVYQNWLNSEGIK